MTQLSPLSVEPTLTVETLLRPIMIMPVDLDRADYFPGPLAAGQLAVQETPALVLAQFDDVDILRDMVNLWNTFIESGQVWALIIGLVVGYFLRGLTTYS